MNIRNSVIGALANGAVLLLLSGQALAAADVGKCSKAIGGEGLKMQSAALKGFQKCNDAYRKDFLKPTSPVFAKAGPACEKELVKIGATAVGEFAKLNSKVPTSCTDVELGLLGHLLTSGFGTRWATHVVVNALQSAYDQEIALARDFVNQMSIMGGLIPDPASGTTVASSVCPSCAKYATAPCQAHACKYVSAGSSNANVETTVIPIPVPLTGVTNFVICNVQSLGSSADNILAGVTTAGEFPVFGEAGKQLDPANLGLGFACVKAIGAEGYITCNAGGTLKVNYDTCQDHTADTANSAGATASGECTGQTTCLQSATDIGQAGTNIDKHGTCSNDATVTCGTDADCGAGNTCDGIRNGGACTKLTPAPSVAGDSFINNTTQIAIVLNTEVGADAKPCTNDDTNPSPGSPGTTSLTTGTVSSKVFDADNTEGTDIDAGPTTGAVFPCGTIASSNLAGAKIVGAFPALHALSFPGPPNAHDSVTAFTIQCN